MLIGFLFVQNHICFVGETSELDTFFLRNCSLCFAPCLRSIWRWRIIVHHHLCFGCYMSFNTCAFCSRKSSTSLEAFHAKITANFFQTINCNSAAETVPFFYYWACHLHLSLTCHGLLFSKAKLGALSLSWSAHQKSEVITKTDRHSLTKPELLSQVLHSGKVS